ncbi:MAG: glycoside hydrolase family 97 protein [Verrucomicrobia bacterium]|nr:glycoside hydrolase family 97 protein [Verrucomicrobiota bacterium]
MELKSPDGGLALTFDVKGGAPVYSVARDGKPIVTESRLGLEIEGAALTKFAVVGHRVSSHDETWKPVYGERSSIRDHYNQLVVDLGTLRLTFRAYDEGVAFCYTLPKGTGSVTIARENTEFRFPFDHTAWAVYSAQGKYEKVPVSKIKKGCERPLVLQAADDLFIAVGEAKLVDFARMKFAPLSPNAVVSDLSSKVTAALPLTTPWRFIMVAESAGRLLENNFLLLNLNDPCAIADTSWIKPGKIIREVTLTTIGGKACVDFAVSRGLQYVEFDAGWYGNEYDDKSDARAVNLDPKRSKGPLDLHEVIRYANERGIGIILYVNRRALERQLDEVLPLYRKWGVKGVKYGFVNVGSPEWTSWLHMAVRKAAEHKLMVDIHDEYRPTGYSRTYPNLMTQEGIGGDETKPVNTQSLTLQFTRFIAGAADNTICYYDARVDQLATHAYQLAKAVCFYSPWQFLYWYDRPPASPQKTPGAGGATPVMGDEPELEFYDHVPTVWDDTKVLQGKIGEYAVIARRSGAEWFIGFMNSGDARTFDEPLTFLDTGKKYTAHVYSDDPTVPTRTHVRIERKPVEQGSVLTLRAVMNGGVAVRIAPQ